MNEKPIQIIENRDNRDYWGTSDIDMAAMLMSCGHKLLDTTERREKGRTNKMVFYFKNEDIKEDILSYTNHTLMIYPRKLFDAYRHLKNLCHNGGYK